MRISLRPDAVAALSWPETPAPTIPGPRQSPRPANISVGKQAGGWGIIILIRCECARSDASKGSRDSCSTLFN